MSGRRRIDDEFLTGIASQYKEHVAAGRMPAPAIGKTEGVPARTVHRWVHEARKRGLLPPGTPPGLCGGARPATPYGPTGRAVAQNTKRLREQRGMSVYALSEVLVQAGRPITPSAVAKLEKQKRHVTVDDLAALAGALGVTPVQLLEPPTDCGICHGTPPPGFACTECGTTTTKEDRAQSSAVEGDGTCTATIKNLDGQILRCAQPAGHYDGDKMPEPLAEGDDPGGWHRSAPDADRDRVTWSDWATGTTPHKETP